MGKRNANGDGSIYQRKDGLWCAAVTIGKNEQGKQKKKYIYDRDREQLRSKLIALQNDIVINDGYVRDDIITLEIWGKRYLKDFVKSTIRETTYDSYDTVCRNHIFNADLAKMKLKDIKAYHLQPYLNDKSELSKSYIKKIYLLLNMFFDGAVRNDLIVKNPLLAVNIPRSKKEVKNIEILTLDQQREYIKAASETSYKALLLTALLTGMRLGEILALKWDKVDFSKMEIRVDQSLKETRTHDGNSVKWEKITQAPKTKSGKRAVPISNALAKILQEHKTAQNELAMKRGRKDFNTQKYVFCSDVGTSLNARNAQRAHYQTCERAGIPKVGFHALRHTFASRMIEKGVDVKIVQAWVGHATIQMTYNIYVHVQEDAKKASAQVQDDLFADIL
ncbi:tyrosine-type recombinase/integrase [Cellulosilyticum sp. WCF-2]|uniref:tyrosine-type recombinase/integrase n=1 Tax=Cellulosilyticum sp. WCF-2 TaxID=2497860 RepID=UPI000F8D499E|nr:site-specific integrase [Cellulosilyticum sp. WCF-2]QEH69761.1 site-specific integrase [Cellulosilyticum sp. WCF-2]